MSARIRACVQALGPRNPQSARLSAAVIVVAAMVASLAAAVLTDQASRSLHVSTTVVLGVLAAALVALPAAKTMFLCVLAPLIGAGAIVVL